MILCCGEALIDMIPEPTLSGVDGFVPRAGGAIFNTAIGLGRLTCRVGLLSGISTDMFGQQLIAELAASHVDTSAVVRSDRPTTLAFLTLNEGQASYAFFDENSAGRMITEQEFPDDIDGVDALFFGGISLACEPAAEAYRKFAQTHERDCVVMVDPNIRPGFISDENVFRNRLAQMFMLADIVKVSEEDLDWIFPNVEPREDKIAKLQALGPSVVILTLGSQGAEAWIDGGTSVSVSSRKVPVVDTVGAGDTFNAGVLAYLSEASLLTKATIGSIAKADIAAAMEFGARVAAVNVSRAGAAPPWRHEI
ncbi:carbohydrate kinase [Lentibacter algarum]|uniref:carbohydrate kinase family protein n=1 Tax=Lentibacter algarum TaxID=576131 RepID=UPI001C0864E3|nr:carbohydrate kinase [Lentibacter algarum]MBU2982648.1 carbohydrate kinase [Lentibacter algarum]